MGEGSSVVFRVAGYKVVLSEGGGSSVVFCEGSSSVVFNGGAPVW